MKSGRLIKATRAHLKMTVKELSDALCISESNIRNWEADNSEPPDAELIRILSFALIRPYVEPNSNPKFTFIDLFAGIGGIRIPFQELGGKCVFSSEWDKFAQKTYTVNFNEKPTGDITLIKANEIPDFDILLAGFPCQPFSQAGLHKGFSDTRGTMFFEIERIIRDKRPMAYLLENVKQLKSHKKGRTLEVIVDHLKKLNYSVDYNVLRARDFGVPQNRERIYIVGFDANRFHLSDDYSFSFPKPPMIESCLGDILESNVNDKYTISQNLWDGHKRRKEENKAKGNGFGYSLFNAESKYTNTISARYYKDGSEILIEQEAGKPPRKLTPRECARLQGFPDDFIIPVSDTQAYRQFGNSVAVPVIRAVAKKMLHEIHYLS